MLRYNRDNEAFKLVEITRINNKVYARVEKLHTEEQKVVEYKDFDSGDFTFNDIIEVVKVQPVKTVSEDIIEKLEIVTPTNIPVYVGDKTIQATTPKGKKLTFDLMDIEDFCGKYKLDVEAVKLVLEGVQKTHRKWGFVTID